MDSFADDGQDVVSGTGGLVGEKAQMDEKNGTRGKE